MGVLAGLIACNPIHKPYVAPQPVFAPKPVPGEDGKTAEAEAPGKKDKKAGKNKEISAVALGEPTTEPFVPPEPPRFEAIPPEENPLVVPAEEAGKITGPYRLEVGDVLDISVIGEVELVALEIPVRPDGMISFAFVGDVPAAGRTVAEVKDEITLKLGQFVRSPEVMVIARDFAERKVFIGGEVKSPGLYYLEPRETTLLDALYKVGLVTEKADLEGAYLMRDNRLVVANFKELIYGNIEHNLPLRDHDLIWVPINGGRFVYIVGDVVRNDAIALEQPVPIIEILAQAGGFKRGAAKREIAVIRGGLQEPQIAVVDSMALYSGDLRQNIMINPGDIVFVPRSTLGKYMDALDVILRSIAPLVQYNIITDQLNR